MLERAALVLLGAYVRKPDARVFDAHDLIHINGAHLTELQKHFRAALDVSAAVDEHCAAGFRRHNRSKARPPDALDALDDKRRANDERPAVARGNERVTLSFREKRKSRRHGGIGLAFDRGACLVVHCNHARRVYDFHMV